MNPVQFYVALFISGLYLFFFFVFYNIAHFEYTKREKIGESSALMFSFGPIISILAPLLAGFFARVNISLNWLFSVCLFLICILLVKSQKDFYLKFETKASLQYIKPTRSFIFIGGIWEALVLGIIPVYTLFFIKTPLNYGIFLSYLGVIAVVSNLLFGRFTDRIQKRSVFLYPITLAIALVTFLFVLAAKNIYLWIILAGTISFLLPFFWNVSTAMIVDAHENLRMAIPARELTLGSGRAIGLLIVFLSFFVEKSPKYIFIFLGFVMLLYPLNLYWNTKIKKKYQYL
ncbi:MAG: hypothetical protein Q7S45_02865 [Candidatus Curtissbacteria bacterium]|nr:hypothetical protein [Candidatus Curtissbacteria bacterium]